MATVEELKEELRSRDLPVSGTKEELEQRLAETDSTPADVAEETPAVTDKDLDALEKLVNAIAEGWVDNGDGTQVHILNAQKAVQGLRNAQHSNEVRVNAVPRTRVENA